jgi:uncharacterized membrane protein YphA (DoxX/SURF4 family)
MSMHYIQDPVMTLSISLAFALLFLLSGIHKLRSAEAFKSVLRSYRLLPEFSLAGFALVIPAIELSLAAALLIDQARAAAAVIASCLLMAYALAMSVNILRGNTLLDCGCSLGPSTQAVSMGLVWRNLVLSGLPLLLLAKPGDRLIKAYDLGSIAFFVTVLILFYSTTNLLLQQQQFTRSLRS